MEWESFLEGEIMELIQKRCAIYTRKSVDEGTAHGMSESKDTGRYGAT